jgi:cell wall-associated NlpC family hydrolase
MSTITAHPTDPSSTEKFANISHVLKCISSGHRFYMNHSLFIISLVWIFLFTACSQNRNVPLKTSKNPVYPSPQIENDDQTSLPASHHRVNGSKQAKVREEDPPVSGDPHMEKKLRNEYLRWLGTKHRLGGNDHNGIDCSGFVQAVYRNAFQINLPRTTVGQEKQGQPVGYQDMRIGDLVFFKTPDTPRHVGIYLGKSQFVHASKSSGVTVSPIDHYYWKPHFWAARRILTDQ